jgi:hypothetical protein
MVIMSISVQENKKGEEDKMYGYKGYVDNTKDIASQEEAIILDAIREVKEQFDLDIPRENCTSMYDKMDVKVVYNKPVHYISWADCYDIDGNHLGINGVDVIETGLATSFIVYLLPVRTPEYIRVINPDATDNIVFHLDGKILN